MIGALIIDDRGVTLQRLQLFMIIKLLACYGSCFPGRSLLQKLVRAALLATAVPQLSPDYGFYVSPILLRCTFQPINHRVCSSDSPKLFTTCSVNLQPPKQLSSQQLLYLCSTTTSAAHLRVRPPLSCALPA